MARPCVTYTPDELPAPTADAPRLIERWRWALKEHARMLYDLVRDLVGGVCGAIAENESRLFTRWLDRWDVAHPGADQRSTPSFSTFCRALKELRAHGLAYLDEQCGEIWVLAPVDVPPTRQREFFQKHADAPPPQPGPTLLAPVEPVPTPPSTPRVTTPPATPTAPVKPVKGATHVGATAAAVQAGLQLDDGPRPADRPADVEAVAGMSVKLLQAIRTFDPRCDHRPCIRVAYSVGIGRVPSEEVKALLEHAKRRKDRKGKPIYKPGGWLMDQLRRLLGDFGLPWNMALPEDVLAAAARARSNTRLEPIPRMHLRETGTGP